MFSLGDLVAYGVALLGVILTILNIIDKKHTLTKISQEPDVIRDARISNLEYEIKELKQYLSNDKKNIDELRASNNIILQSLFSLLAHSITGNSIEQLKQTQTDLQRFLASRGISV